MKKQNLCKRVLAIVLAAILAASVMFQAPVTEAKMLTGREAGCGCRSGKYIYYAFEMGGVRMGIRRYDIKTKKNEDGCRYYQNKR